MLYMENGIVGERGIEPRKSNKMNNTVIKENLSPPFVGSISSGDLRPYPARLADIHYEKPPTLGVTARC